MTITGRTLVAGVAGRPVAHSLSPLIHNAWLKAAGVDGVYVAFSPLETGFAAFANGLRGGVIRGLNVTIPFKEDAMAVADAVSARARKAGAANLLTFAEDGQIIADNTDGLGLLGALAAQAPGFDPAAGPVVVLGAGGAARGAAAALLSAGAPEVRIVNRTISKAEAVADVVGPGAVVFGTESMAVAFEGATCLINATSAGLSGAESLAAPLEATPVGCVVMDMVYKPLLTPFLSAAQALGRPIVDGLEMLVRQAEPSFEAFYGEAPPAGVDVRKLCLEALGQ